ncbi:hypothetical protein HDU96_002146 [Phlyctochytrium bullatum]|nr:hypothetical protein HDU96_002146 [Phlyctochytrium bullatum]
MFTLAVILAFVAIVVFMVLTATLTNCMVNLYRRRFVAPNQQPAAPQTEQVYDPAKDEPLPVYPPPTYKVPEFGRREAQVASMA